LKEPKAKGSMTQQATKSEPTSEKSGGRLKIAGEKAASVARILLAVVFIVSGVSKLYAPASASTFAATILPITADAARIIVVPLSLSEVAAGCLLMFDRWVTAVAGLSSLFFLSAFFVGLFFLGGNRPCGCFGDLFLSQTDEWFVFRSLVLLFLSLFVFRMNVRESIIDNARIHEQAQSISSREEPV
jgi:uncharacterized membrane protein YphA (DoxX/SURF4 family)